MDVLCWSFLDPCWHILSVVPHEVQLAQAAVCNGSGLVGGQVVCFSLVLLRSLVMGSAAGIPTFLALLIG